MPKARRFMEPGYIYHLITRGNNKQMIFKEIVDFQKYLYILEEARNRFSVKIYNYVLMQNHIHLLIEPKYHGSFSKMMEVVSKNYAKYFNQKYNHVGHVFQGRFKSFVIFDQRYFFICNRYIDWNPIKANMVSDPKDYTWSGYQTLAFGKRGIVTVDLHELYLSLAGNTIQRQEAYRSIIFGDQYEDIDLLNQHESVLK